MKDDFGQPTYTHPPVLDETGLIAFLKTQPDIAAAYLFGSLAQGRATPRSDIDHRDPSQASAETVGGRDRSPIEADG